MLARTMTVMMAKTNTQQQSDEKKEVKISRKKQAERRKIYIERKTLMRIIYDQKNYLDDEDNADTEDDKINGGSYADDDKD